MSLSITEPAAGVRRAVLEGRIDFGAAQTIDGPLAEAAQSADVLLVDLSGVEFIASMGLRVLLRCAKLVGGRRGRMALVSPRPGVFEVLRMSGLEELIPVYPDEASAFAPPG